MDSPEQVGFDSDGLSVIVYNYGHAHIWSEEDIFTDKIELIISNWVTTIGGKDITPKGIGTVIWYWTVDEGQPHRKKFNNVLYFPYSPVNILSETSLVESIKYDEGTWVLTKINILFLFGILRTTKNIISHSENYLPEL